MGRHSAPDEPDVDSAETTELSPIAVDLTIPSGRHSQLDDGQAADEFATVEIPPPPPVAAPDAAAPPAPPYAVPPAQAAPAGTEPEHEPDKKAAKQAEKQAEKQAREQAKAQEKADKADRRAEEKADKSESSTRADLRMLRQNSAVRAQALAAVIGSFLVYTVVMLVTDHTGVYLQWVWIPIVVSGFLVGLVLDLGHRRSNKS
jgi:hypothetical protein